MRSLVRFVFALSLLSGLATAAPAGDGLALTPPMGWNSWNKFGCDVSARSSIKAIADAMVRAGMRDAGYQYLVIDDCWQVARDALGQHRCRPAKFPSG